MNLHPRQLTGRISFRQSWTGAMVAYVEVREPLESPGVFIVRWKRATAGDIATLNIGVVIAAPPSSVRDG